MEIHQRLHDTGVFGASQAATGPGASAGGAAPRAGQSRTYVARPLSPNSLRRARNAAWSRAGFDPIEPVSAAEVSAPAPAPATAEDDTFRRAAAASLAQQRHGTGRLVACLLGCWPLRIALLLFLLLSSNVHRCCLTFFSFFPSTGPAGADAPPVGVCANTLCPLERPENADFCPQCAAKVGQARVHNAQALIGALVKRYFLQLTAGCGLAGCENPWCVASGQQAALAPQAAAVEALRLARLGIDGDIRVCLDTQVGGEPGGGPG